MNDNSPNLLDRRKKKAYTLSVVVPAGDLSDDDDEKSSGQGPGWATYPLNGNSQDSPKVSFGDISSNPSGNSTPNSSVRASFYSPRSWSPAAFTASSRKNLKRHTGMLGNTYTGPDSPTRIVIAQTAKTREAISLLETLTTKWQRYTEKMVVQLIKMRADVHQQLQEPWDKAFEDFTQTLGATALHFAARRGLQDVCRALINNEANVDARTNTGTTPLMVASMFAQTETINILIEHGAGTMIKNDSGMTALDIAALEGKTGILELLLDAEMNEQKRQVGVQDNMGLFFAATGVKASVERMLKKKKTASVIAKLDRDADSGPAVSIDTSSLEAPANDDSSSEED